MTAPLPPDEESRLEALHRYGILDTEPEQAFEDLVRLAASICRTPMAALSLVDSERQWFKARIGLDEDETPRDVAFCSYTILSDSPFLVPDALADDRFSDNPVVTSDPEVRFYAAAPLKSHDGFRLGTLCVLDRRPRVLSDDQIEALATLSRQAMAQLELRQKVHDLDCALGDQKRAETEAQARARQQAAVVTLGSNALSGAGLEDLLDEAVRAVAEGLGTEYAEVFELTPSGEDLWLRAGSGFREGLVGSAVIPARNGSQAGFTLHTGQPVIVTDLRSERRFTVAPFMADHGVLSGLTVGISVRGLPWAVLGTHSTQERPFSADDVNFVQAVAHVLAAAIERHRHEEEQEKAHQQDRLAAVGQLAAGVAHDFNNIISVVNVYAELLDADPHLHAAGRTRVAAIRQQVERATSLVWQVLDFARGSALDPEEVELGPFLDELVPMLTRALPAELDVALGHDGGDYVVRADASRLQQILMNLVTNASDAMDGSGQLTIALSRYTVVAGGPTPRQGLAPGPWIGIHVTDTGCGMTPEVLARVFEPFFTTKPPGRGTGLGLAQVHGLVAHHGGQVGVVSSPGEGTTVSIWLPATGSARPAPEPATTPPASGTGVRVLVVEDDVAARTALTHILEWLGYAVLGAADGEEAVGLLERNSPSVKAVISDVMMPGMGGEGLARVLAERWPDMPLILVTGYPTGPGPTAHVVEGLRQPVTRLQKPFSSQQMAEALRGALQGH